MTADSYSRQFGFSFLNKKTERGMRELKGKSQSLIALMKYILNALVNLPVEIKKGRNPYWVAELGP